MAKKKNNVVRSSWGELNNEVNKQNRDRNNSAMGKSSSATKKASGSSSRTTPSGYRAGGRTANGGANNHRDGNVQVGQQTNHRNEITESFNKGLSKNSNKNIARQNFASTRAGAIQRLSRDTQAKANDNLKDLGKRHLENIKASAKEYGANKDKFYQKHSQNYLESTGKDKTYQNVDRDKLEQYGGSYDKLRVNSTDTNKTQKQYEKDVRTAKAQEETKEKIKNQSNSAVGRFLWDAEGVGTEMLIDQLSNPIPGAAAAKGIKGAAKMLKSPVRSLLEDPRQAATLGTMGERVWGQNYTSAKEEGASNPRAELYGIGGAALEGASELMFGMGGKLMAGYGGGLGDDVVERALNVLANKLTNKVGPEGLKNLTYGALNHLAPMITEGLEEGVADIIDPRLANLIYANSVAEQTGDDSVRHQFSLRDMAYDMALGGFLGGMSGTSVALQNNSRGQQIKDIYGPDGMLTLANKVSEADEDIDVNKNAQVIIEQIKNGMPIANGQAVELMNMAQEQSDVNMQNYRNSMIAAEDEMKSQGLSNPYVVMGQDENGNTVLDMSEHVAEEQKNNQRIASEALTQVLSDNKGEGDTSYQIDADGITNAISDLLSGSVRQEDTINLFNINNTEARTALEHAVTELTGEDYSLPKSNKATREELFKLNAQMLTRMAAIDKAKTVDQLKGLAIDEGQYGAETTRAYHEILDNIDDFDTDTARMIMKTFRDYARAGALGLEKSDVDSINHPVHQALSDEDKEMIYNASVRDNGSENLLEGAVTDSSKTIEETAKEMQKQGKTVTGGVIVDPSVGTLPQSKRRMLDEVGRTLNVKIHVVTKAWMLENGDTTEEQRQLGKAPNGYYSESTGEIFYAIDSTRPLEFVIGHETLHHLKAYAPSEYKKMKRLFVQQMGESDPNRLDNMIKSRQALYKANGQTLSKEGALEEIMADQMYEILQSPSFWEKVEKESPSLAKACVDAIRDMLDRIRRILTNENKFKPEDVQALYDNLGILDSMEDLALAAYKKASENALAVGEVRNSGTRYQVMADPNGTPYVVVPRNVFDEANVNGEKVTKYVENILKQNVGDVRQIMGSSEVVYIGTDFPGEFTGSNTTRTMRSNQPNYFTLKFNSSPEIGEMLGIASNGNWTPNKKQKHDRDAKYGWYRFTTRVLVPKKNGNYHKYRCRMLVRWAADNNLYLYDVESIKTAGSLPSTDFTVYRGKSSQSKPANNNIADNLALDKEYLKAAQDGDTAKAQQMVDNIANQKGLTKLYHGTNQKFNTFKANPFITEQNGVSKIKGYFASNPEYSETYGDVGEYYVNTDNYFYIPDEGKTVAEWEQWFKNEGIANAKLDSSIEQETLKGYIKEDGTRLYSLWELTDADNYWNGDGNLTEAIQNAGYDGIFWNEGINEDDLAYMPFNDTAIKSTAPVTYNDKGDIIPLSKRFNEQSNDIRFSIDQPDLMGVDAEDGVREINGVADRVKFNLASADTVRDQLEKSWNDQIAKATGNDRDKLVEDKESALTMYDSMRSLAESLDQDEAEYPNFKGWNMVVPKTNREGKAVGSVIVTNGEYSMNIDFSTICKKRRALDRLLFQLSKEGMFDTDVLEGVTIVELNEVLAEHGYEVSCPLCFVDTKRYAIYNWADSFTTYWNGVVNLLTKDTGVNASDFNFLNRNDVYNEENPADQADDSKLNMDVLDTIINYEGKITEPEFDVFKDDKGNMKGIVKAMAKAIKGKPDLRKKMTAADILASPGQEAVRSYDPELFTILNGHMGSAKPKNSYTDTPSTGEILASSWTPEKAFEVGGVRIQSFSDYIGYMFFDYVQTVAELEAKGLPVHGYTKEADFVRIFGKTGIKINMSLVPKVDITDEERERYDSYLKSDGDVKKTVLNSPKKKADYEYLKAKFERAGLDENGNYLWADESFGENGGQEGFDLAKKLLRDDDYHKNVGTIAVGVSDAHIRKLLNDPDISMVIPYHASGINKKVAIKNNIDKFRDYTKSQNDTVGSEKHAAKLKTRAEKMVKDGSLSKSNFEKLSFKPGVSMSKFYNFGVEEHFDFYDSMRKNNYDAKKVAKEYLADCDKKGIAPVFSQFRDEEGYYKMIIDFNSYDRDGNVSPQTAVKSEYPDNVSEYVKASVKLSENDAARLNADNEDFKAMLEEARNVVKPNEGNDVKFSIVEDENTLDMLNDAEESGETVETYRAMTLIDGKLYPPMASKMKNKDGKIELAEPVDLDSWYQADELPIDKYPELYKNGKFQLRKDNGKIVEAAYNPYIHSSLSPLNDQFAEAWKRPNMVVVKGIVPKSELTSGYRAEGAKDTVGSTTGWNTGPVAKKLTKVGKPRVVILSRWFKPLEVMSDEEVAKVIKNDIMGDTQFDVPYNVVTPSLRSALENEGVNIVNSNDSRLPSYEEVKNGTKYSIDSEGNELSPEQEEFFKDSKVRDEDGRLVRLYHGTTYEDFTMFKPNEAMGWGKGIYLTNDLDYADYYSEGVRLMPLYANLVNPYDERTMRIDDIVGYEDTRTFQNLDEAIYERRYEYDYDTYEDYAKSDDRIDMHWLFDYENEYRDAIADILRELGYDGIIGDSSNGVDGLEVVAFYPNQVKNVDNENPTSDPDIRYTIDDVAEYIENHSDEFPESVPIGDEQALEGQERKRDTIAELENRCAELKEEMKLSHGKVLNKKSVKGDFNELVRTLISGGYKSGRTNNDMVNGLVANASTVYRNIKEDNWDDAAEVAYYTARELVDELVIVQDEMFRQYRDLAEEMKSTRMVVPQEVKDGIEEWNEFRKSQMGKLRLVNNGGVDIDVYYEELADRYPELFDKNITHPVDQLQLMAEVRESMRPYDIMLSSEDAESLAKQIAIDVLEITSENGESKITWADKKKQQYDDRLKAVKVRHQETLNQLREKERERTDKLLKEEREKGFKRLDKERARTDKAKAETQKQKDKAKEKVSNSKRKAWRDKIEKDWKWLADRCLHPTESKPMPERLRKPIAELLITIDAQSLKSKKAETKATVPIAEISGHSIELEEMYNVRSQKYLRLDALKLALKELADTDESFASIHDEGIEQLIDNFEDFSGGRPIDELDDETMDILAWTLKQLRSEVGRINKAFMEERSISELGEQVIAESKEHMAKHPKKWDGGYIYNIFNSSMVTPVDFFERLGDGMHKAFMNLRNGDNRHMDNMADAKEFFTELFKKYNNKKRPGSKIKRWRDPKKKQTFKVAGGEVSLTVAQMMALYCTQKRAAAMGHLLGSGIVPSDVSLKNNATALLGQKNSDRKITKAIRINEADIQKICNKLTDEQKAIADELQNYINTKCTAWGNETSMLMYGYNKFGEPNYFPMKSERTFLDSHFDKEAKGIMESIKNMGFTKELTKDANNGIVIDDIFAVVTRHISEMSLYNSFAAPISDFTRLYNYRNKTDEGLNNDSVKSALDEAFGSGIDNYITHFMSDVQGQNRTRKNGLEKIIDTLLANSKKASIGANIRVALQQPTAIVRALALIDPKYFVKMDHTPNLMKKMSKEDLTDFEEMVKYCPVARRKSWGFSQTDLAMPLEDIIMNEWSMVDALTMEVYGALDNYTWTKIWKAVKAETRDKHPEVEYKSEEFFKLCSERATEVFDKTQVVDSVFHRSDAMRSDDVAVKMATAFMAEPTRTYNMLRTDIIKTWESIQEGDKQKGFITFNRCMVVFVANAAACAVAQSLGDALRNQGSDGDDKDKEFWLLWYANFRGNILLTNLVPILKEFGSWKEGWGASDMTFKGLADTVRCAQKIIDNLMGKNDDSLPSLILDLAKAQSSVTGIPVKNFLRDAKAMVDLMGLDAFAAEKGGEDGEESQNFIQQTLGSVLGKGKTTEKKDGSDQGEGKGEEIKREDIDYGIYAEDTKHGLNEKANHFIHWASQGQWGLSDESYANEQERKAKYERIQKLKELDPDDLYKEATSNYTKILEVGDVETIREMRNTLELAGGDVAKFDKGIEKYAKAGIKKSIGKNDAKSIVLREFLKDNYGYTDETISREIIEKSDLAKEFQKAAALEDHERAQELAYQLADVGLTYDDFNWIYQHRWNAIEAEATGTYKWPVEGGRISSNFGARWGKLHGGMDIAVPTGTPVTASDGGVVTRVASDGSRGLYVDIKHPDGTYTRYQHLSSFQCEKGQKVSQGQPIALSGNTGNSTGPHLHFAVYQGAPQNGNANAIDPRKYLAM